MYYIVRFITVWGADDSINAPENPHTGNMLLITHNEKFQLFEIGKYASKGVSDTAMYGTLDSLFKILDDPINANNIGEIITADVLSAPGSVDFEVEVTTDKSFLSFITMIAPSSDWFTGFEEELFDRATGKWLNEKLIVPLYVYVAGTDSNQGFVTEHKIKTRPDVISVKNDTYLYPTMDFGRPIAYAVIEKKA